MARKRGPADVNLTLGINPEYDARRIADEMSRGFKQAGNQAGLDYNNSLSKQLEQLDSRVSRAMRGSAKAIIAVDETTAKAAKTQLDYADAVSEVNRLKEENIRVTKDATATEQDRIRVTEELNEALGKQSSLERRVVEDIARRSRANEAFTRSLGSISKAMQDINDEGSAGETLLSAGKFISALRAVAIPAVGGITAITGSAAISSLAILSQSLWMIPAGIGGVTAAIGSLKIATLGFSDAVENMGDAEKFYEALQNLSPNAQQAALAIQALTDPLKELKNATQDAFFADFAPMLNQLANQYMPMLTQLTTGIAGAFNNAFSGIFDQLMTPQTQAVLQSTVDNLVDAFERLAPAAAPFVDAITRIVQTGSSFLPGMADSITRAAEGFANFIKEAQESGKLEEWMRDGITAVGQLWDGIKEIGKAFASLADTGKEQLPQIIELIKAMANGVPPIFEALSSLLTPIAGIATAFNRMWDAVGPILTVFTDKVGWLVDKVAMLGNNPLFNNPFVKTFMGLPNGGKLPTLPTGQPFTLPGASPLQKGPGPKPVAPPVPVGGNAASSILGNIATGSGAGTINDSATGTGGIAPVPAGGYPMPPPPPEKGSGGSSKADEPPFTADPSTYSLDNIPIGSFFGDATGGPVAATTAPAMAPVNMAAIPQRLGTNPAISAVAAVMDQLGLQMISGIAGPNSPTKRPFDGGWHDTGQAGDFSNSSGPTPEMRNAALWLASNFGPMIEELIYNDDMGGVGIDKGVPVDAAATFGPTAHRNHIHLAVRDEIVPYFLQAMQESLVGGFAGDAGYFAVDQQRIVRLQEDLAKAERDVLEKRQAYLKLTRSGTADQLQMERAKNDVLDAETAYRRKEQDLAEARLGTYKDFDSKLENSAKQVTGGLSQVGAQLANDFGISEGLPGIAKWITTFLANMAFAPMIGALSAVSAVSDARTGTTGGSGLIGMFAPPTGPMDQSAMGPAPLGGGLGATLPGMPIQKFDAGGILPPGGIGVNMTSKPEPVLTGDQWSQVQTAMQSATPVPHGTTGGTPPGPQGTSMAPSQVGGGGFTGLGGMPLQAIQMATMGLDAIAPGAGAAAQIGIQLANRAAGYMGQLAGIGVGGLLETFLPNNSTIADPNKSWIGRIASGISGARPATANAAGGAAPAKPPAMPQPATATAGGGGPVVLIENMVNNTTDSGQTLANQIARQGQTGYLSRMGAR